MSALDNDPRARQDLAWCAALWLIVLLFDASGADVWFTRLYGSAQGFAWRNHWLTSNVMHQGGRWASWVFFGIVLVALWRPWPAAARLPVRTRVWWLGCTALCLLLISMAKYFSVTSCPWDLREFGGAAQWLSHWAFVPDGGPGRCFPSGHASGAFAFVTGYLALREVSRRHSRAWLIVVLALGAAFGWAQLMRGAHHLSHTLWTAAICWTVAVLTYHGTRQWRLR